MAHRIAGEVHVLRGRRQRLAFLRAYRHKPRLFGAIVHTPDARRTHLAAADARPDDVADANLLDRLDRTVTHHHFGAGHHALVVVTDRENSVIGTCELLQPRVLQPVRILKLVDQDVAKPLLIMLAQHLVSIEKLVTPQQQLGEVDHTFAIALRVILRIQLDEFAVVIVVDFDRSRRAGRLPSRY